MQDDVDYPMTEDITGQENEGTGAPDSQDVWEDIDMPVDENFRYAMRDASEMLRQVVPLIPLVNFNLLTYIKNSNQGRYYLQARR
jgi:hypothetical protein